MSELQQFFAMGGHGIYVWSAYAITFVVLVLNVMITRHQYLTILKSARRLAGIRKRSSASTVNTSQQTS